MDKQQMEQLLAPTRFDRVIAGVFPKWGASRMRARREFAYEAARNTRLRSSARVLQGPEDYTAFPDRIQLIKNMRDLEQNFGLFQCMIDKLTTYSFGRVNYQAHTGNADLNKRYEEYLAERFVSCDLSGRNNLRTLVQIAFKSMLRDGDFFLKWGRDAGELKLSGIEGDRVGGNTIMSSAPDYFQGITVNLETGKPIKYTVFQRTKANAYTDPKEITASDMFQLWDPRRIDQYRGITPFAPILNEARDLKEVLEACLVGTKFENYHAAVGYTADGGPLDNPETFFNGAQTNVNGQQLQEQDIKIGKIQWAPTGSKLDFLKSDRPSQNFQTYVQMLVRLIAGSLNLSYGFVYQLLGTGPAVRAELQSDTRTVQSHQINMKDRVLEPVKNTYLMEGFATGAIPYTPRWKSGTWQFPASVSIDVGRESAAGINEVKAGLLSKASWFAEIGEDAEEQEEIIASEAERTITRAKAISEKHEIPLDLAMNLLEIRTPTGVMVNRTATVDPEEITEQAELPEKEEPTNTEMEAVMREVKKFCANKVAMKRLLDDINAS